MRAEVAVLTRDVVIEGDADSARDMFGAVVMLHAPRTPGFGPSNFWLEQIEVRAPQCKSSAHALRGSRKMRCKRSAHALPAPTQMRCSTAAATELPCI